MEVVINFLLMFCAILIALIIFTITSLIVKYLVSGSKSTDDGGVDKSQTYDFDN